MMKIISVEKIGDDHYTVTAGDGSETCQSVCKVQMTDVSGGGRVKRLLFESHEFQKFIMLGEINIKEIAREIERASS